MSNIIEITDGISGLYSVSDDTDSCDGETYFAKRWTLSILITASVDYIYSNTSGVNSSVFYYIWNLPIIEYTRNSSVINTIHISPVDVLYTLASIYQKVQTFQLQVGGRKFFCFCNLCCNSFHFIKASYFSFLTLKRLRTSFIRKVKSSFLTINSFRRSLLILVKRIIWYAQVII